MNMNEVEENLEWRIGTDEMIAVELKNSHKMIGIHGNYWKRWNFSVKPILEKMCISGKMKLKKQFGKIPMYMPN